MIHVADAGLVHDPPLGKLFWHSLDAAEECLVERQRSLAASQHDHRSPRCVVIGLGCQRGDRTAHRVACHAVGGAARQSSGRVGEPEAGEIGAAAKPRRRAAGDDILFQQDQRDAGQSGGPDDGHARESAQPDHERRLACRQERLSGLRALPQSVGEPHRATEHRRRGLDGQGDVFEAVIANDLLFDAARRADEQAVHRPAGRGKSLSDGDAGKKMSARSAASEHDRFRRVRSCGESLMRASARPRRQSRRFD